MPGYGRRYPAMTNNQSTDIWFRAAMSLDEIAIAIGMSDQVHDAEDYWEWVIGELNGIQLDLTRSHTKPRTDSDTRIFRLDNLQFSESEIEALCDRLCSATNSTIRWGRWEYISGNDYNKIIVGSKSPQQL